MILAFYRVDNSLKYERHTFDDLYEQPNKILDMLKKLDDDEWRLYHTSVYGYGDVTPCPNMADFEDDYNDEILDGGWWCVVIRDNNITNN